MCNIYEKLRTFFRNCISNTSQQIACCKLCVTGAHCNCADVRQPDDSRHKGVIVRGEEHATEHGFMSRSRLKRSISGVT